MEITLTEIKEIAKTLPIGYYAKRRVGIEFSETEDTSFYDMEKDCITFAYKNITDALKNTNTIDKETTVRTILYHELSHAIMTPPLPCWCSMKGERGVKFNIFEDERIETLLNKFYLNTNFKEIVKVVNNFDPSYVPQSAMEAFFELCRFRRGPENLLQRVDEIIDKYKILNKKTTYPDLTCYYIKEIENLYADIEKYYNDPEKQKGYNSNQFQPADTPTQLDDYELERAEKWKTREEQALKDKIGVSITTGNSEKNNKKKAENIQIDTEMFGRSGGDGFNIDNFIGLVFGNSPLKAQLAQIINSFNKKNNSGNGLTGYSGRLNPRLCGNDNYKIFDRKAETRGNNKFGSLHLNLFIDVSGSFYDNKDTVNTLLRALLDIERTNPNFSFNTVHCGHGEHLMPKGKEFIDPDGGNNLTFDIVKIYKELQKPNTFNYNIILFDGHAGPDRKNGITPFEALDFNNVTFISDEDNKHFLEDNTASRVIITKKYTDELYKNVLSALQTAFR